MDFRSADGFRREFGLGAGHGCHRHPEAPFTDGRAQSVEVPEARIEQDAVIAGTKRLQLNSQLLRLAFEIENEQTWMMHVSSTPGLPWGVDRRKSPIKVEIAADGRSVTRSLRMEGAENVPEWQRQAPGRFRQTVRLLGKDACRIETEVGFDDSRATGATGQGLRVPRRVASDARVVLRTASGERSWTIPTFNLWDKGREKFSDRVFSETDPLELVFDADRPEGSFSFSFDRGSVSRISCSLGPEYATFSIVYAKPLNGGPFAMDFRFRECPVYDSRGSVEGVNFRRANAFEVSLYDAKRNFFLNPSFESDARYWQNVQNGFDPNAHLVTNDVHSGRFALSLVKPAQTFSFPVRNPVAGYVATAAQTELLGNARFLKDVCFGDGARCYIFDDGKGHAVGAFWTFDEEMVRGRKSGGRIGLDFSGMDPLFFDMMANGVSIPVVEGRHMLPLGPYPVYVVVPIACTEKLAHSVASQTRSTF